MKFQVFYLLGFYVICQEAEAHPQEFKAATTNCLIEKASSEIENTPMGPQVIENSKFVVTNQ